MHVTKAEAQGEAGGESGGPEQQWDGPEGRGAGREGAGPSSDANKWRGSNNTYSPDKTTKVKTLPSA